MKLPEEYAHLKPWERFVDDVSGARAIVLLHAGFDMETAYQILLLQSLHEAGCLRKPETARKRRQQKHLNESRGQEPI